MSGTDPASKPDRDAGQERTVLGSLPRRRPSVRSPRRKAPEAVPEPSPSSAASSGAAAPSGGGAQAEIEALARASLSLAAGLTVIGVRAVGRATAALRDAVERS